jgi:phosphatidate cytidylyltransferase
MAQEGELAQAPRSAALGALAWAYTGLLPAAVVALRENAGWQWVVLLFVVTWANDTLAYFTGRFLGKRPFAPRISPKKTWEGFWGGAAGSIAGAVAVKLLFLPAVSIPAVVVVGAGAAALGPLGDLSESMLKRAAGVKDSGRVIPGHGGLLDRIDAVLFVAPWVVACAMWLGR